MLQTAIGPMILISGVGMLLLEHDEPAGADDRPSRQLLEMLRHCDEDDRRRYKLQLDILWRRAHLLQHAISLIAVSAFLAALLVILLFFCVLLKIEAAIMLSMLFILCLSALIAALVFFLRDINLTLHALAHELGRDDVPVNEKPIILAAGRQLLLARKVFIDRRVKLGRRRDLHHAAAELARTGPSLGIAAGVLAHQHRALLLAESLANEIVVVQQQIPLFLERRIRRHRLAAERRGRLRQTATAWRATPARSSRRRRRTAETRRPPCAANRGRRCRSAESVFRCGLIAAMRSQSAEPRNMSAAVRPWTVSAAAPAPSTTWAMSIALILSRVQPRRILAVTGVGAQALTTRSMIAPIRSGSRSRYDPLWAFCATSRTGQPKLMSTTLTLYSLASRSPDLGQRLPDRCPTSARPAAAARRPRPTAGPGCSASCSSSQTNPLAQTISVASRPAPPNSRTICRKA